LSPRPSPSPVPALAGVEETPTGEYEPAQPAQPRATVDYVDSWAERFKRYLAIGAAIGGAATGTGMVASHYSATDHADKAVNERTAALEARHEETRRRLDTLEVKVDELRDNQDEAEAAAKQRQAELLEAIKKGRK
jgi:hypothetical protein